MCWSSYNFASITVFQSLKNSWEVTTTFCFNAERKCKLYLTSAVSMYQLGKVQNSNSAKYNLTERNETIPFLIIVAFKLYTCWYFPSSYLDLGFCLLKWVFAVVSYKRGGAKKGFWGRVLKVEMGFEFTFGPLITQYFNLFSVLNPCSTATTLPLFSGLLIHTSLSVLSTLSSKQQRKNSVKNGLFSNKLKGLNDACDFLRRQLSSISLRVKYLQWNLLKPNSTFFGSKIFFDGHKHVFFCFSARIKEFTYCTCSIRSAIEIGNNPNIWCNKCWKSDLKGAMLKRNWITHAHYLTTICHGHEKS